MKVPPAGSALRGEAQEPNTRRKPQIGAKRARFDTLVARYYASVYSFASRLTDDPREAIGLTREAFNSTQKQLGTLCDENLFASILLSTVIRRL
jgi:DNA-directed RNA polymerase specialized sigma24 family protein